ncbi:MAG: response regulator [Mucilaginibacter sp.]|jgi:signal transduction histidine kinase|nr:response regulator [Mucilaginibacter sp.]
MLKPTDKYHHKMIKDDEKHLNPYFDIKEVPKRSYQLGIASLFTGVGLSIYDSFIGMYVSSFLVACFCFSILMFILLKYNGAIENLTISIITMVCGLLMTSAYLEGLQSEQYLYFFPLLVAVPIIVDLKRTQYRQTLIYISIIVFSFGICVLIGRKLPPVEVFNSYQITHLAFVNRIVAIFSTIAFAVAYIFFEKKYINELMEQSTRIIDSRTQFLATMGHELRTPLNGIIGIINLLKQEHNLSQQHEYIQILKYCSDHMLQQVNNILDFNKIEANNLEIHPVELNLRQLLMNVGMPFIALCQEKGLELKVEIDPELDVLVFADDLRLIQIFNNLFSNALKFTEKGFIKLKVQCKNKSRETIDVTFMVEDSGIGISNEDQKKIFESFWQVYDEGAKKLTGTGLGLTICVRLLKLMNSNLTLVSEKGRGSKFIFDLNLKYARVEQQFSNGSTPIANNLSGIKVLLVEDNEINMLVATQVLTDFNAIVTSAYDGKEALEQLEKNHDQDIILMDLQMPVMNGYIAMSEAKKLYPKIPVIAFTASLVDQKMLSDLLASGFVDCILKPFQPHQMLSTIKKHLIAS